MKQYLLYARKSSERDERQIQSIEDQINFWGKRTEQSREFEIIEIFREEKSAKAPNSRPEFKRMIERIEKGGIDGVLCWKLNRLTRNPVDTGTLQYMLQKGKLEKIITNEREYRLEDSGLLFSVETGMANQFILDLSKDTIRGMQGKVDRGGFPGVARIGYLNNKETKEIDKDPERFEQVRRMWEMILSGLYSPTKILEIVNNDWGFRTLKRRNSGGKPLGRATLYEMFRNPFYAGCFLFKWALKQGNHTPMITMEEFERAQQILDGRMWDENIWEISQQLQRERPKTHTFAFTGNIVCGECGCMITAETKTKTLAITGETKEYHYYHCTHRKNTKDFQCSQRKSISTTAIEKQISDLLGSIYIHPEFLLWAKTVLKRRHQEESAVWEETSKTTDTRIADLEKKLNRLMDLLIDGTLSQGDYLARKSSLDSELTILESKRKDKRTSTTNWFHVVENTLDFASKARERFEEGDLETKKLIFRSLGSNWVLIDGKLTVDVHSWFSPLQKYEAIRSGSLSRLEPTKKGISMRNTDTLLDWNLLWLPEDPNSQTVIEKLYIALCLDKRKLIDFLKEPYEPIVPIEPKSKKEKKVPKDRKKFPREDARRLLESGSSYVEIANIYGVSRVAVWKALNE